MDLDLNSQELSFRDALRAWQRKIYEGGWAGISRPKEYGGRGATFMESTSAISTGCSSSRGIDRNGRPASFWRTCESSVAGPVTVQNRLPKARVAVSIAKAYASDAYREVGNKGIQFHGGRGFTWKYDLHLYYRRAKDLRVGVRRRHLPSRAHRPPGDR